MAGEQRSDAKHNERANETPGVPRESLDASLFCLGELVDVVIEMSAKEETVEAEASEEESSGYHVEHFPGFFVKDSNAWKCKASYDAQIEERIV